MSDLLGRRGGHLDFSGNGNRGHSSLLGAAPKFAVLLLVGWAGPGHRRHGDWWKSTFDSHLRRRHRNWCLWRREVRTIGVTSSLDSSPLRSCESVRSALSPSKIGGGSLLLTRNLVGYLLCGGALHLLQTSSKRGCRGL